MVETTQSIAILNPYCPKAKRQRGSPRFPVFAKTTGGRYTLESSRSAFVSAPPIIMVEKMTADIERNSFAVTDGSIVKSERDEIIRHGVVT